MTVKKPISVLFLCTGNSARSILSEAILNRLGKGEIRAFSAGSHPRGDVNPYAIELLDRLGYHTNELRSKSWDEFSGTESPAMDYVITVCGNAAGETCPLWPGRPITAHWDIRDPATIDGTTTEKREAFAQAYRALEPRIRSLVNELCKDSERANTHKE